MEIEKKNTKSLTFGNLKTGDVFLDKDNNVMMVVEIGDNEYYDGYAIDLKTGDLYGFYDDDRVIKVSAKLTITD